MQYTRNPLFILAALLLFSMAAGLVIVNILAFDHLVLFLEKNFSPDGSIKERIRVVLMLRLYGIAMFCVMCGLFLYACSSETFRAAIKRLALYDGLSKKNPTPSRVFKTLTTVVIILVILSIVGQYFKYVLELGDTKFALMLYRYFNLDKEHWVPTTFSFGILLYSGVLLANIAHKKSEQSATYTVHWSILSVIFIYLAIDEKFRIHERAFSFLKPLLDVDFASFWVVPAGLICLLFVTAYSRFLFHLSYKHRLLFVTSGMIYVTGAIGFELISRNYLVSLGQENFTYEILANVEEVLEMMGIVLFIYTLQSYIIDFAKGIQHRQSA